MGSSRRQRGSDRRSRRGNACIIECVTRLGAMNALTQVCGWLSCALNRWPPVPTMESHSLDTIRCGRSRQEGGNPAKHRRRVHQLAKTARSKIRSQNKCLRENFNNGCVLFVQHPTENTLTPGFPSGSFVACAGPFSNCDVATEGGIPRSSRFRWFA